MNGYIEKKVNIGISVTGISIGYNSTIFTTSNQYIYALDYDGNTKWRSIFYNCYTTPLISSDTSLYVANNWNFLSLSHRGDTLWNSSIDKMVSVGMNIDLEGNLYYIDYNSTLIVLDKNGKIKWKLYDSRFLNWVDSAPTFSPNGKTLYIQGKDVSVLAVDIESKSIKWIFGDYVLRSSPVVDNEGNIFLLPGSLDSPKERIFYSLNSNGKINWKYEFISNRLSDNIEPTIDYHGNIYFATDTLYSLTHSGKFRWKISLESEIVSPLICDKKNNIYIGTFDNKKWDNKIISINDKGETLWERLETEERLLGVSPALSENGILFYPTWDNSNGFYLIIK